MALLSQLQHTVRYTELASDRFKDDRSEIAILIHEQFRRTLYYPNDRRSRQFGAFGETKISIEIWPDAAPPNCASA